MLTAYDIFYNDAEKYYLDYEKNKHLFGYKKLEDIQKELFDLLIDYLKKETSEKKKIIPEKYLEIVKLIVQPSNNPYLITCNPFVDILREVEYKQVISRKEYVKPFEDYECKELYKNEDVDLILLYSKVKSNDLVSLEEFRKICHYVSIGHKDFRDKEAFAYIFRMVIDYNFSVPKYEYHSIMKRFAKLVAHDTGLDPIDIFIRNKENVEGDYGPFSLENVGKNEPRKRITLYTSNLDYKHIMDNINTIFHEVSHGHQIKKLREKSSTSLNMIKDLYLKDKLGKLYEENYWYLSYEVSARRVSACRTIEFLEQITSSGASKYKKAYLKEIENSRRNNNRTITSEEDVYYSDIDSLFKKYVKEALDDEKLAPILSQEYNKKGKRKSIVEFLLRRNDKNKSFYDSLIYDHEYTLDEIKESLLALKFYIGKNPTERAELQTELPLKLLDSLDRQIYVSGLNKTTYDKKTVDSIRKNLRLMAKNNREFRREYRSSIINEENMEEMKRR